MQRPREKDASRRRWHGSAGLAPCAPAAAGRALAARYSINQPARWDRRCTTNSASSVRLARLA